MRLICRPIGRGCWRPVIVTFRTPGDLFAFRLGERFTLGGITYRVSEIQP